MNPVKDQAQCGSCWAFSAIGALEGRYAIKNGKIPNFSEQQLVDCANAAHNSSWTSEGCNGGEMDDGFDFSIEYGNAGETEYPYKGVDGKCNEALLKASNPHASKRYNIAHDNNADFMDQLAQGPISVAIEADTFVFQFYSGGVFNNKGCGTNLDHGVVAVGYGNDAKGGDYIIIRNSWGASWGEKGYIRFANTNKNDDGICGVQMEASAPQF